MSAKKSNDMASKGFAVVKIASSQLVVSVIIPTSPGAAISVLVLIPNLKEKPISLEVSI